jgi:hypothetical protein
VRKASDQQKANRDKKAQATINAALSAQMNPEFSSVFCAMTCLPTIKPLKDAIGCNSDPPAGERHPV